MSVHVNQLLIKRIVPHQTTINYPLLKRLGTGALENHNHERVSVYIKLIERSSKRAMDILKI